MKKIFAILCVAGIIAASCKFELEDDPALTSTYSTFSFAAASVTVTEGEQTATATINRGNDAYEGTLTLQVVTTGSKIINPATEGTDFTLSSKTVKFDGRYASETVAITTAAADGKTAGDKQFGLRLAQAEGAVQLAADTLWVTIKDVDAAVISFEVTENLTIVEDGSPVAVTIIRTGADWAGTVKLNVLTSGLTNPAEEDVDYVLSDTVFSFAFGETSKIVTITPRADDGDFTGNTPFVLNIKSAPGATIEDGRINVTITEAGGFAGFQTFLADFNWEFDFRNRVNGSPAYSTVTFTPTSVDSVYTFTLSSAPLKVVFSKQDYSMTVELPQYGGIVSGYYARWSGSVITDDDEAIPSETPVKLVLPFEWVTVDLWSLPYTLRGYQLPTAFLLGLWAYSVPDYVPGNCLGFFRLADRIFIANWS
jgi:hypothetical protein